MMREMLFDRCETHGVRYPIGRACPACDAGLAGANDGRTRAMSGAEKLKMWVLICAVVVSGAVAIVLIIAVHSAYTISQAWCK
jgi:hypothetical protein